MTSDSKYGFNLSSSSVTSDELNIWFENALNDVFYHTTKPLLPVNGVVNMVKNESEGLQLAVRSDTKDINNLSVSLEAFDKKNAPNASVKVIELLYSSQSSHGILGTYGRKAGFIRGTSPTYFPEYYDNKNTIDKIKKGTTRSFLIEFTTNSQTDVGEFKSNVMISTDKGNWKLPVSVFVHNLTIPEPKDSAITSTTWPVTTGLPEGIGMDREAVRLMYERYYNVAPFTDKYWQMMENFAKVMKKERQNAIMLPLEALLLKDLSIDKAGNYSCSFIQFDRFVETFLKNGSIKYLESEHFFDKDWSESGMPKGDIVSFVFYADGEGKTRTKLAKVTSTEAKAGIAKLYPLLFNHLKDKGWDKMWLQHVLDEPFNDLQARQAKEIYLQLKSYMPTLKTIDAGSDQYRRYGNELSVKVPQIDNYQDNKAAFNAQNGKDGVEIWTYTCVNPQGGKWGNKDDYITRVGDYPLISTRMTGWFLWQNNLKGFLHWAWNVWRCAQNNETKTVFEDIYCNDAVADAWLVYPDKNSLSVFEGPRATAVRDGFEDYEILLLANKKDPAKTKQLVSTMVTAANDFNHDTNKLLYARTELIKIAEQ